MTYSTSTKKTKSSKRFIPTYYDFIFSSLGLNNIYIRNTNGTIDLYVKPLIRVIISDLKNMVPKGQESLSRQIKEKLDPNSRLLLKKGMEGNLPMTIINGQEFVHINCRIRKISDTAFRVMNDMK